MKAKIEIEVDLDRITGWTDEYLVALFAAVQIWDVEHGDGWAEQVTGMLRWEIIRRWLRDHGQSIEMYHHQEFHSFQQDMHRLGAKYEPGGPSGTPDWYRGAWVIPVPPPEGLIPLRVVP